MRIKKRAHVECGDGESPLSIAEAPARGSSTLPQWKAAALLTHSTSLRPQRAQRQSDNSVFDVLQEWNAGVLAG